MVLAGVYIEISALHASARLVFASVLQAARASRAVVAGAPGGYERAYLSTPQKERRVPGPHSVLARFAARVIDVHRRGLQVSRYRLNYSRRRRAAPRLVGEVAPPRPVVPPRPHAKVESNDSKRRDRCALVTRNCRVRFRIAPGNIR